MSRIRFNLCANGKHFFVLTATISSESVSTAKAPDASRCAPVSEGRTLSNRALAIRLRQGRHCTGSAPKWQPAVPVSQSGDVGPIEALRKRGAQPQQRGTAHAFSGMAFLWASTRRGGPPASTPLWPPIERLSASSLKNRIEDLARSATLVPVQFQRIFAARETSCLRCNEPSASRNLALGTTGIEVQGYLETTQNERFNDASDFGTSLTLAAPAAGYRDPTPNSTLDKRALGTLMRKATFSPIL